MKEYKNQHLGESTSSHISQLIQRASDLMGSAQMATIQLSSAESLCMQQAKIQGIYPISFPKEMRSVFHWNTLPVY